MIKFEKEYRNFMRLKEANAPDRQGIKSRIPLRIFPLKIIKNSSMPTNKRGKRYFLIDSEYLSSNRLV